MSNNPNIAMIAQGSIRFILPFMLVGTILSYFIWFTGIPFLIFGLYLAWFFRDPNRKIQISDSSFLSPADGKVIQVIHRSESTKIAVRMSPFNVHLNRSPLRGKVTSVTRTAGKHNSVYFSDVEKTNEKNLITIENEVVVCNVLQITGIFARRIECWIKTNEKVVQGQKIGIIRFGSQTNIHIRTLDNTKSIKPTVKVGDKVEAGISVLAIIEDA
ncbi:MAG: phosphatidylserine decarboxylase family protein [Candidatus Heimdallarchaeota archaeon]|nr:phosphatidylserine decarboxylase family protein [Candidatus Heimdallarchaeota archaeon]